MTPIAVRRPQIFTASTFLHVHYAQRVRDRARTFQGFGDKCRLTVWELFGGFLHTFWSMATLWVTHECVVGLCM